MRESSLRGLELVEMIADAVVAALCSRLTRALAPPRAPYRPLRVEASIAGWLNDARAARLARTTDVFVVVDDDAVRFVDGLDNQERRSAAIDRVARELAAEGELTAWRDERYAVAPEFGGAPWFLLERAAARYFGIHAYAAHVNGVVRGEADVRMWLARRSATKAIDPGMLDNLVGGGIAVGQSIAATVIKESREEAGIAESLSSQAQRAGTVTLWREQPDGLQHDTIFVHDLWLPDAFSPAGEDGEVVDYRLVTLDEAAHLLAVDDGPDAITADASLVIVDFLIRHGHIGPGATAYEALDALRRPQTSAWDR
jgi:8-oxo-dGTP pyrophosphatase MutT (NUDIX family)